MPSSIHSFAELKVHSWNKFLKMAGNHSIDHSPFSWHRSESDSKAWRLFNRIRGIRMTLNEARNS